MSIGFGAIISAIAIILGGIKWLANKLNPNTTIIRSCLPFLRIGDDEEYYPIKSQQEFSQIIAKLPFKILQKASIVFFIRFSSKEKNENRILYKATSKPRFR